MKASKRATYLITVTFLAIACLLSNMTVEAKSTAKPQYHLKYNKARGFDGALRSLAIDLERALDLKLENAELFSEMTKKLGTLATQNPKELQKFVRAFSQSGSKVDRQWARHWAEANGFLKAGEPEPVPWVGVVLLVGLALLVGNGCDDGGGGCGGTCPTAGPCPDDGSTGGSSGGSTGNFP